MSRRTTKTYNLERKLFYTALVSVFIFFVAYMYFVSAAIAHVVVRKELAQEITETQTRISELEFEYIAAQNAVSEDVALARGFQKNEEKVFVERASPALVLSRNDTR